MPEVITLYSGDDCVIVEPCSEAEKVWQDKGYSEKNIEKPEKSNAPSSTILTSKKKRGRKPKKSLDIGITGHEKEGEGNG